MESNSCNMLTIDGGPKVSLSKSCNHSKSEGEMRIEHRQIQEKKMMSDTSLTPMKECILLRRKYHIIDNVSKGTTEKIENRRGGRATNNINDTTFTTTAAINLTNKPQQVQFIQQARSKHSPMLLSTDSYPFNTICLADCKTVARCNRPLSIDISLPEVWHRQSIVGCAVFITILATLILQPLVAGQQPTKDGHLYNEQSLPYLHEAEISETVLWPVAAAAATTITTATTSGGQQKRRVEKQEEEIPKALSEQHQNKSNSKNQQQQKQRTSYHDLDLHLDSLHSSLLQSINLSKQQRGRLLEQRQDLKEQDKASLKRSKRSSKSFGVIEDMGQQMREFELDSRRKPVLISSSGLSKRSNLVLGAPRDVWQQARFRRLDDTPLVMTNLNEQTSIGNVLDKNKQTGDCNKLLKFWTSFKFSYPSLAAHLITVHAVEDGPQNIANQFSFKMAQLIKSIARLLNEAELLARSSATSNNSKQNPWLSRVFANPMYAKIVSQFSKQSHFPTPNQQFVTKLQQQQPMRANNKFINNHMIEANQQQSNNSDGHVYGRVIHYPHELSANDGSSAKTLQKLRELSNSRKLHSDHSRSGESQPDRELKSNRIQTMLNDATGSGGDGEPWTAGDSQKSKYFPIKNYDSDLDSARNKFVYGSILLKPHQSNLQNGNHNLPQRHHSSIETLRQLQQGSLDHQTSVSAGESYGRVLVSPASHSGQQHEHNVGLVNQHHRIGDTTMQQLPLLQNNNQQQQQQDHDRWLRKPTLDKLKQKLDSSANQFESASNFDQQPASSENGNADELSEQQHGNSMAAHSGLDLGANSDSSNEFEGDWHSGPLQQVEIRQPRNDGSTGQVIHTTLNPRDVFMIE